MDDIDPIEFLDRHYDKLGEKAFVLTRSDMCDDYAWVDLLTDLGVVRQNGKFAWRENLGLDDDEMARMERVRSVFVRPGSGAYLSPRRVKPETWARISNLFRDPSLPSADIVAMPVALAKEPNLAESIVDALLEDDVDAKDEINSLFEVDLMPLREALKKKFRLTSVVIHAINGVYKDNYAEVHFCVAREGTSAWSGTEATDIRMFILEELLQYTDVKRRKDIEFSTRVEPKKLKGQWPYLRLVFHVVFEREAPQFIGIDTD